MPPEMNLREIWKEDTIFRWRRKPKCSEKTCAGKYGSRTKFTYDSGQTGNRTRAALVKGTETTAAPTHPFISLIYFKVLETCNVLETISRFKRQFPNRNVHYCQHSYLILNHWKPLPKAGVFKPKCHILPNMLKFLFIFFVFEKALKCYHLRKPGLRSLDCRDHHSFWFEVFLFP